LATHCATDHHIVELSPTLVLRQLDDTIGNLSDPIGDPLTVPNAIMFNEAAQYVGIVMNGEGGDPCFGGPKNLPMLLAELYPLPASSTSRAVWYLRAHQKCYDDLDEMLSPAPRAALAASPLEAALTPMLNDQRRPDFIARLQALNIRIK